MTFNTKLLVGGAAFLVACIYWYTSAPISAADTSRYGGECAKWISEEFGEGRKAAVGDSWRKRGHLVFEVLVSQETGTMADVYLCAVDKDKGTMLKPGAFDQGWR